MLGGAKAYGQTLGAVLVLRLSVLSADAGQGPTSRMTDEKLGELGPLVKRAAKDITRSISGSDQIA